MKILSTLACLFCVSYAAIAQPSAKVFYVPLAEGVEITANPVKEHVQSGADEENPTKIKLYPNLKHQVIQGIGGCFNEIGGEALLSLDKSQQKEVMEALFNPVTGSGFDMCRMSIGSSDFGIDAYSFSEVADDYDMKKFSLKREKEYMLPFIQQAVAVNKNLRIFGSPWSPPAWMKGSGVMDNGKENEATNYLIDDEKIYKAYALYFAKYVEGYKKAGVDIERICIQNEQDLSVKYPSCRMPVEQMSKFVQEYMRPLFTEKKIKTEIWGGTFRTARELEGQKFVADPALHKDFDGIGIQYTLPKYLTELKVLNPEIKIMHTEGNCHDGGNTVNQARTRLEEIANYLNAGSENFCYWNMILNETGLSGWDWRQNALININRETKTVTYNPDYAVISLISRYIRPQSTRISSFSFATLISVERDGAYYLILQNNSENTKQYTCDIEGEFVNFELPALSLCAIEIK